MKLKTLCILILVIALTVASPVATAVAQCLCPQPTCNPWTDPNCDPGNGCNGQACAMPTINLNEVTAVSQFHGIK